MSRLTFLPWRTGNGHVRPASGLMGIVDTIDKTARGIVERQTAFDTTQPGLCGHDGPCRGLDHVACAVPQCDTVEMHQEFQIAMGTQHSQGIPIRM
jgi:hypothetical protein